MSHEVVVRAPTIFHKYLSDMQEREVSLLRLLLLE